MIGEDEEEIRLEFRAMQIKSSLLFLVVGAALLWASPFWAQDSASPSVAPSTQSTTTWTILQAKVVAQEKLNTGTLVTVRLPLNDPDGTRGVAFLTSQSPFVISKSGTLVFWSGWMDHSPQDDAPALWHPLTPASIEVEISNKDNGELGIDTRAVEPTQISLKKVESERLIHRIDDNTVEVSLYFEIREDNIAGVGMISYNDFCSQDRNAHKECRVNVLPVKEIMTWARQKHIPATVRTTPTSVKETHK